jgi:GNAT superfamily N-acetyltransferase
MTTPESALAAALLSERLLRPHVSPLKSDQEPGRAKALLIRHTDATGSTSDVVLAPITSASDWSEYLARRIEVERGFGGTARDARRMIDQMHEREHSIGLRTFFVHAHQGVVGAIAQFPLPQPHQGWARLQEVDVFPGHRGNGYGDAALTAMCAHLASEGRRDIIVGAEEADWPLSWYRRRGFHDVARVPSGSPTPPRPVD